MKLTNNFRLAEFIDPETYKQYGEKSIWFIDPKVVAICQKLRERMNKPLTVNNWYDGGDYSLSGFRPAGTSVGASKSQHKFGRAADVKMLGEPDNGAFLLRDEITFNFEMYRELGLTTIEDETFAPTWCHFDIRWTKQETLFIMKP